MKTNILLGVTLAISAVLGAPATSGSTSPVDRRELNKEIEGRDLISDWLDQWRGSNGGAATTTANTPTQTSAPPAQTTAPGNAPANPAGCPDHEILFGECSSMPRFHHLHTLIWRLAHPARGTSEPGTFGTIVGDPLMKRLSAALFGAEGYAVDVRPFSLLLPLATLANPRTHSILPRPPSHHPSPSASRTSSPASNPSPPPAPAPHSPWLATPKAAW